MKNETKKMPKVGVGVCIMSNGKVLLGKRKGSHGEGDWSFPGGHLEFKETWEECAKRETLEETGLKIENVYFATATNDIFEKENKHYVTVFMIASCVDNKPKIMEPEKCEKWEWFKWNKNDLPKNLFVPLKNLLKQNYNFDIKN